ncbi:MAG: hypothetical protein Faunusvirus23_7 [Faunusvirus sp.]|jgi:hypothetical protein|uniref:Ankyrin repeat protein n=1 Tax=Faunusvirus sp. TaxID=2487766 RepID=A0A3G4ZXJ7_9VIRU|nr:MAG: hypothetical protein Faunusvirus23_7 [Faunusvirus sp.]
MGNSCLTIRKDHGCSCRCIITHIPNEYRRAENSFDEACRTGDCKAVQQYVERFGVNYSFNTFRADDCTYWISVKRNKYVYNGSRYSNYNPSWGCDITPIIIAVMHNQLDVVKLLMQYKNIRLNLDNSMSNSAYTFTNFFEYMYYNKNLYTKYIEQSLQQYYYIDNSIIFNNNRYTKYIELFLQQPRLNIDNSVIFNNYCNMDKVNTFWEFCKIQAFSKNMPYITHLYGIYCDEQAHHTKVYRLLKLRQLNVFMMGLYNKRCIIGRIFNRSYASHDPFKIVFSFL